MGLLQLTDFSGGYATDLDSEQMAPNELLTATNCQWRNKIVKRKGTNQYADVSSSTDDLLGGCRVFLNDTWIFIIAKEASSAVKLYQGTSTSYTEITDEKNVAYTLTADKEVFFSEVIGGSVLAVNGTDRPTVIHYDADKTGGAGFVARALDRYDERVREIADWTAGQYDHTGGAEEKLYTDDTTDAQDDGTADFAMSGAATDDGHYIASDFVFTLITYDTIASSDVSNNPVATFNYWNGSAWVAITSFNQDLRTTWATGDKTVEFELPLDADGDLLWKPYDSGDTESASAESLLTNKFAIKVAFTTVPTGAMTCKKISKVAHTHYLTQIMKDDKPSCVTVHKHRPVFGANKVVQLGKINSVKGWDAYDVEYAALGGKEVKWLVTHQDYLAIIKENAIYGLYGNSLASWSFKTIANVGTISGPSVQVVKDILFMLGTDGNIYAWNGSSHTTVSSHIKTDLDSFTRTDAVATKWQGEYWLSFPTNSTVITSDPDTFRIPPNSNGEGRMSFYKFTSYRVDQFINVEGADETLSLRLIGTDRTGGAEKLRYLDNGATDHGSAAITMTMKTKEFSDNSYGVMKRVGRIKATIDSGNGNHTVTVGNNEGDTSAHTITNTTDYITPSYTVDGERVFIQLAHSGATTSGVSGFAMPLAGRRF